MKLSIVVPVIAVVVVLVVIWLLLNAQFGGMLINL